jgi:hypothetical protein
MLHMELLFDQVALLQMELLSIQAVQLWEVLFGHVSVVYVG